MTNNDIVQKLWNLCDVLRDDGINYSDYVTELVLLLFIKMVHENTEAGTLKKHPLPEGCRWTDLNGKSGINLLNDYKRILLSLSTGIFYAQGVKTNVLFFTKGSAGDKHQEENCTENVWVYDLRTNMSGFGKRNPFGEQHLEPFEKVYDAQGRANAAGSRESAGDDFARILASRQEGEWSFNAEKIETPDTDENQGVDDCLAHSRWRCFSRKWIAEHKGDSLDISWLKDADSIDAANLPEPSVLASEAMSELVQALGELDGLMRELGAGGEADAQKTLLAEIFGGFGGY